MPYEYNAPDSWYEEPTSTESGWVHQDDLPDLEGVKDYLKEILRSVYVTGDIEELENSLGEICSQFDLKLPAGEAVLCRKLKNFSDNFFDFGVALSRAQTVQLTTR